MKIGRHLFLLYLSVILFVTAIPCRADNYPSKPIGVIVPFSAGAGTDFIARTIGQKLSEAWKQPVVVENRVGAGGVTGANIVAKAKPDGYTLVMGTIGTHSVNHSLYKNMPYDTLKDFTPIIHVGSASLVLFVHSSLPVHSMKELIAYAKAHPGKLDYATGGIGSSQHLPMELFKVMTGIDMLPIHYKGGAPAYLDLVAGRVPVMLNVTESILLAGVKSGTLRALAVGDTKRTPSLPDVPTFEEAGVPGYQASAWQAVFAPAGTPADIVTKLNREINQILTMPDVQTKFATYGLRLPGGTPADLRRFQESEVRRWAKVIKEANITTLD